jgi:type II secretory pathway pseudopilin PulG
MNTLTPSNTPVLKRFLRDTAAFSLVEVTLALGIAAFCLVTVFALIPVALKTQQASIQQTTANSIASQIVADLSAALRLPPGQRSKQFNLHGHWAEALTPDILYFAKDGTVVPNSINQNPPPTTAVFMAAVTYLQPPTETTSLADITVGWPAAGIPISGDTGQPDFSKGTGKVESFAAINR